MPKLDKKDPILKAINAMDAAKVKKYLGGKKFDPLDLNYDQVTR